MTGCQAWLLVATLFGQTAGFDPEFNRLEDVWTQRIATAIQMHLRRYGGRRSGSRRASNGAHVEERRARVRPNGPHAFRTLRHVRPQTAPLW